MSAENTKDEVVFPRSSCPPQALFYSWGVAKNEPVHIQFEYDASESFNDGGFTNGHDHEGPKVVVKKNGVVVKGHNGR